ncbi:hypothetical protein E4U21_004793 [Claviceps maximensis]|nr:hypothetical protein E4U21_004793 [Claviceps maximensis]
MTSGKTVPSSDPQVTFASGRASQETRGARDGPDIRILHYNDVYHVDAASAEPVGGFARFITLCKEYQEGKPSEGQPNILTLFSGDAFNPSLESSVTKGETLQNACVVEPYSSPCRTSYGACVERNQNGLRLCWRK